MDSRSALHPLLAPPLSSSALPPPSLSRSGGALGFAAVADPVSSAVLVFAPTVSPSLFRPFDAPSAVPSGVVPPLSSLPPHGSSPLFGSAPLSGVLPPPAAPLSSYFSSAAPSRPGPSFPDDSTFDPDFADPSAQDPELPLAPPVPDSVRAEIRRMYSYVVDFSRIRRNLSIHIARFSASESPRAYTNTTKYPHFSLVAGNSPEGMRP